MILQRATAHAELDRSCVQILRLGERSLEVFAGHASVLRLDGARSHVPQMFGALLRCSFKKQTIHFGDALHAPDGSANDAARASRLHPRDGG